VQKHNSFQHFRAHSCVSGLIPIFQGSFLQHIVQHNVLKLIPAADAATCCHTSFDESDGTVSGADSVQVSLWPDAQSCSHGLPGALQNLHGPLGLFHVLKVLRAKAHKA